MRRDKTNSKKVTVFKKKGPAFKEAKSTSPKITFTKFVYTEKEKAEREIRDKIYLLISLVRDEVDESHYFNPKDRTYLKPFWSMKKEKIYEELDKLDKELMAL